jgi:cytochrome b subunit of formate dehydrogenase
MKRSEVLFILAVFLFLLSLLEAVSGFVFWLALPHGGGNRGADQVFWNLTRTSWVDIHDWAAVALLVILIVHIILHWKWIVRMFKTCCPYLRPRS